MHLRATLAAWAAITALVVVVFCVVALPDPAGWAAGYLRRWEIAFPMAVLAPMLISLTWTTIKASGKIEYLGMEFYDPLGWLRIGVWLDQVFLHPWQWATSSLQPIPEPPTTELHRFQIRLTPWVLYAEAWPDEENQAFIHWVLARQPVNDEQFFVIVVAKGRTDARLGYQPVIDLAAQRAQRSTYGVWGVGVRAVRPDAARQRLPHNRLDPLDTGRLGPAAPVVPHGLAVAATPQSKAKPGG